MSRPLAIALLLFGTIAGYGAGFAHLHARHHPRGACAGEGPPAALDR